MEAWLDNVMVEHTCPDCKGARVRATRLCFIIDGKTIHDLGQLNFDELHAFLGTLLGVAPPPQEDRNEPPPTPPAVTLN